MTKQSLLLILALLVIAGLLGYNFIAKPFANLATPPEASLPTPTPMAEAVDPVTELLSQMTPRQKITQLLAVGVRVDNATFTNSETASSSAHIQWVQRNNPGTVVLFGSEISTESAEIAQQLVRDLDQTVQASSAVTLQDLPKPLIAVDHEGGTVQRLNGPGFTKLASWYQQCQGSSQLMSEALTQSALELRQVGVDIVFAPVVDVAQLNQPLGSRICSGDYDLVVERAKVHAHVFQQAGIIPVFKHFPGIGETTRDLHLAFDTVLVSEESARLYRELLSLPDQIGVMVAHVGVENQDPNLPCSLSAGCVSQVSDNYPEVLVFTDDLLMESAYHFEPTTNTQAESATASATPTRPTLADVMLRAIVAGNHQLVIGTGYSEAELDEAVAGIEQLYQSNTFVRDVIDRSVEKVVRYKHQPL